MAYATVEDVEVRLGRELTPDETDMVTELLEDVEAMLLARIPDLHEKVDDGTIQERLVVMVEANAVIRVLRNPDAFLSETDGNYSYTRSSEGASGFLSILPNEWDWLTSGGSMYQIIPVTPTGDAVEGSYRQPDAHYWCPPSESWYVRVR